MASTHALLATLTHQSPTPDKDSKKSHKTKEKEAPNPKHIPKEEIPPLEISVSLPLSAHEATSELLKYVHKSDPKKLFKVSHCAQI